jgi:outer membrane protein assembly factor BamB
MNNKLRVAGALAALALVSGCGVFKGQGKKTPVLGERVPILMSENDITSDKSLANVDVILPEAAVNEEWTQPGGSASKSMGHLALSATPARAWSKQVAKTSKKERLAAAPVIAGGKLFVMDTDGVVHAMAADSGNPLWTAATVKDEGNKTARFGGGVSVEGEHAYATNGLGDVVALNVADGTELWRKRPGGPLRGAPTVANDKLYVVTQDNQLFAIEAGQRRCQLDSVSASLESQGVFGVAAPASAQGTVIAGFSSGELNAYRFENGQSLWSDVLSRSSDDDFGLVAVGHRCRAGDRSGPRLCRRAGRPHGRDGHRHRQPHVGTEHRRHLDARGSPASGCSWSPTMRADVPVAHHRQGALDLAAQALQERQEAQEPLSPGSAPCWPAAS